ncbi:MAG: ATP-binding protein [Bacillota bacterium]|nr:MAG: ATP-binding protein [Bacillota bacterium]
MKELSLHVLDIVENSLRAGATEVEIKIVEDSEEDLLSIEVKDNGSGMDEETVKKVIDPFFTTRTERKVGLGIPLLSQAAKAAGGGLTIESIPGHGTTVRAWFQKSHIDLQPLGDMAKTMSALVALHPEVDFVYTHVKDDREFSLNTKDMKARLQEIPVNHPLVIDWISKFIKENLDNLNGGAE